MASQTELFPGTPAQASLFGDGDDRIPYPAAAPYRADPDRIRRKLTGLLAKARAAETMPWSASDARMYATIFPNMANWLPDHEADQLRFAFAREMERLSLAA